MRIISLASGSKGNALVVEAEGARLLIDCGLAFSTLSERLGFTPGAGAFAGVLLTHSHGDHTGGLKVFQEHCPDCAFFANALTAEVVAHDCALTDESFATFENEQPFSVGPFEVVAFPIPHDTSDPVGFLVRAGGETYFHATDVGTPLDSIGRRLAEATCATLESNHDPVLLRTSGRPRALIERIEGPRGHLSNDEAAAFACRYASPRLKSLGLAHLSHNCNAPSLALETMRAALAEAGRGDIALKVYTQNEVVPL